jgi:outer membrane protein assembly factor BamD
MKLSSQHRIFSNRFLFFLLSLSLLLGLGCGGNKVKKEPSAEELYQKASKYMEPRGLFRTRNYPLAIETFDRLIEEYPFSDEAIQAQLRIGDIHFEQESYPEAIGAYQDFLRLHPRSPEREQLLYRIGISYYEQIGTIDRDQNNTVQATKYLKQFLQEYPSSDNASEMEKRLKDAEERLMERQVYIGRFYFRNKEYQAAWHRFENVLESLKENSPLRPKALYYAALSLEKIGEQEKAANLFGELVAHFPNDKHASRAQRSLDKFSTPL